MEKSKKYLVTFIIPYFGLKLPKYIKLFIYSCSFNKKFKFIFFSDITFDNLKIPDNISWVKFNKEEFKELIKKKIGIETSLDYKMKIVDFKPCLGILFEDYLVGAKFWGHMDIDLILGDLYNKLGKILKDNKYDILSFRKEWLSGSLAIYRNITVVNELFKKCKGWNKFLSNHNHCYFDECGIPKDKTIDIYKELERGKKIYSIENEIDSFTHVLEREKNRNKIKIYFHTLALENINSDTVVKFNKGALSIFSRKKIEKNSNNDYKKGILYYHYVGEKNKITFDYPDWNCIPDQFYITKYGFHKNKNNIEKEIFLRKIKGYTYKYYMKIWYKLKNYWQTQENIKKFKKSIG